MYADPHLGLALVCKGERGLDGGQARAEGLPMQRATAPPSPGWRPSDRRRTHVGPALGAAAVLLGSTSDHGGWAQSGDSVEEAPEQSSSVPCAGLTVVSTKVGSTQK